MDFKRPKIDLLPRAWKFGDAGVGLEHVEYSSLENRWWVVELGKLMD